MNEEIKLDFPLAPSRSPAGKIKWQECHRDFLRKNYLNSSELNKMFYNSNHFLIGAFFHPDQFDFLSSCLSFDIYSLTPFPEDINSKLTRDKESFFFGCRCDFKFGLFPIEGQRALIERQRKIIDKSILLLKSENYDGERTDALFSIISSGLTKLRFEDDRISNLMLERRVFVNSAQ